jgi:hypothetical protein
VPECGKHALKRLVSAPMFRLSGSGWYETDFKSDQETKRNLATGDKEEAAEPKARRKAMRKRRKPDGKDDARAPEDAKTPRSRVDYRKTATANRSTSRLATCHEAGATGARSPRRCEESQAQG